MNHQSHLYSRWLLTVLACFLLLQGCDNKVAYDDTAKPFSTFPSNNEVFKLPDSGIYRGEYSNSVFHGDGELVWRNGDFYKGEFESGMMHGSGVFEYASGQRYEGEFKNGMPEGNGTFSTVQGDRYVGDFAADEFHGKGRFEQKNGDVYEGDFEKGLFTGKGTITIVGTGKYEGEVENWKMHGKGVYTPEQGGTLYSGNFVEGTQSGQGEIITKKGDHYTGNIEGWTGSGQGELKRSDGEHYIGEFKFGVYHGQGSITYKNKNLYQGEFESGMRHGKGVLVLAKPKGRKKSQDGWWQYGSYIGEKKPDEKTKVKASKKPPIDAESIFYRQAGLLENALEKLQRTTPAKPDLYMINFASYGRQDVFMREARYARKLFDDKLGTKGYSINLINNHKVAKNVPLASVTNLNNSIKHIAEIMDKEEDILFLFLTSHGSAKHELSVSMEGLPLNNLPAEKLASMIKDSGIKWKVIVVSSCYSGGFIKSLKDEYTMVLTASKADHVSFGCSDEADFTFFGRAFFKNALNDAVSFTQAFSQASALVNQWENDEKYDHSEPQIWSTSKIEKQLLQWRKTLSARVAAHID